METLCMLTRDGADDQSAHAKSILTQLAAVLDCPVEAFSKSVSCDLGQRVELLRLWELIESNKDREKVLEYVKNIVPRP